MAAVKVYPGKVKVYLVPFREIDPAVLPYVGFAPLSNSGSRPIARSGTSLEKMPLPATGAIEPPF